MKKFLRLGALIGLVGLLAACNTTGTNGVSSSVSTHNKLSNRTVVAYAKGLKTKPVKKGNYRFLVAHSKVQLGCLRPELTKLLVKVEKHYGKPIIITSGYRSKAYNRRVRGAKNSQHTKCKAADIRVPGVSKQALAKYARTLAWHWRRRALLPFLLCACGYRLAPRLVLGMQIQEKKTRRAQIKHVQ